MKIISSVRTLGTRVPSYLSQPKCRPCSNCKRWESALFADAVMSAALVCKVSGHLPYLKLIFSRFLGNIKDAFDKDPNLTNLLLDEFFKVEIQKCQAGWRRVVSTAVQQGVPTPAFSTALAFYDGYRSARLPANLLQVSSLVYCAPNQLLFTWNCYIIVGVCMLGWAQWLSQVVKRLQVRFLQGRTIFFSGDRSWNIFYGYSPPFTNLTRNSNSKLRCIHVCTSGNYNVCFFSAVCLCVCLSV